MMINQSVNEDEQWAPVSDLMAVLMLIFMFIAIIFIHNIVTEKERAQDECDKIYRVLEEEFSEDFKEWQVDLLKDLTIRFRNPEILFLSGQSNIRSEFEPILTNFFPRYIEAVIPYKEDVQEIRIEGHTSSEHEAGKTKEEKYILNMELSQNRARDILRFILQIPAISSYKEWAVSKITANGLSSSKLIDKNTGKLLDKATGKEDLKRSRRVEFRLLVSSCQNAGVYSDQN